MDLKITGTVKQLLEEQSGESRNGPWRKQEFILETADKFPKSVCIVVWGDNVDQFAIQVGEELTDPTPPGIAVTGKVRPGLEKENVRKNRRSPARRPPTCARRAKRHNKTAS